MYVLVTHEPASDLYLQYSRRDPASLFSFRGKIFRTFTYTAYDILVILHIPVGGIRWTTTSFSVNDAPVTLRDKAEFIDRNSKCTYTT